MTFDLVEVNMRCALCKEPLQYEDAPRGHEDHRHLSCPRCNPGFLMCFKLKIERNPA